jgi:hypothetical protein
MKTTDVRLNETYLTKIGDDLVEVYPIHEAHRFSSRGPKRWTCKRADNGKVLPKPRTAAALRLVPGKAYAT